MRSNTPLGPLPVSGPRAFFNTPLPLTRTNRRLFNSAESTLDSPHVDSSPNSGFSLNEECRNYLLCTYCCQMLTPPVYACTFHPSTNICESCRRREANCGQCRIPVVRNGQFELMLEMFSVRCEDCGVAVRLPQYGEHQKNCYIGRQLYCPVELLDTRCGYNTASASDLFTHFCSFHNVPELTATEDLCPLPFLQIQRSLGDLNKPLKSAHTLPFNCSIHYAFVVTFTGRASVLAEFFYRLTTKSFFVVVRSPGPVQFQLHWLVSKHSIYGLNNELSADKVDICEGRACKFSAEVPLHLHQVDNLRSIACAEIEVLELMEKFSFLHGDGRFLQFALRLL